nr:unnamed protein product [Callosobruchus analis]
MVRLSLNCILFGNFVFYFSNWNVKLTSSVSTTRVEIECPKSDLNVTKLIHNNFERDLFYTITVYKKETVSGKIPGNLKCPVCMDYMTNEIYFCGNGHSVCGQCNQKQSNRTCPVCRGNMLDSRNFGMENSQTHEHTVSKKIYWLHICGISSCSESTRKVMQISGFEDLLFLPIEFTFFLLNTLK